MSWIRRVAIEAVWECDKAPLSHSVPVEIEDTYDYKPRTAILNWVSDVAVQTVLIMCRRSCHELSDSVFCDENTVDYVVIDGPTEEGEEEWLEPEMSAKDKRRIEYLEKQISRTMKKETKEQLQDRIDEIKQKYKF
jgi:hypothetical protein